MKATPLQRRLVDVACVAVCVFSSSVGCQTAGTAATYKPDSRSWIATPPNPRDRAALKLRDPLTNCVLRCREDVEARASLIAEIARVKERNARTTGVTMGLTFPFWMVGGAGLFLSVAVISPTILLDWAIEDNGQEAWRRKARAAEKQFDWAAATSAWEYAVALGDEASIPRLAHAYDELGRDREAAQTAATILCRSETLAGSAVEMMQSILARHGPEGAGQCKQEPLPVPIPWAK